MGVSSSQPVFEAPQSSPVSAAASSTTAKREPHYSPKMDDDAASQQLVDELQFRAVTAPEEQSRTPPPASAKARKERTRSKPKSRKKQRPVREADTILEEMPSQGADMSQLSQALPVAHEETNGGQDTALAVVSSTLPTELHGDSAIEVPDSQSLPTVADAPMSPPMTSSILNPPSSKKKRSEAPKRKRTGADEDPAFEDSPRKSAMNEANETATSPAKDNKKRQRIRWSYTTTPAADGWPQLHCPSIERDFYVIPASSAELKTKQWIPSPVMKRDKKPRRPQSTDSPTWKHVVFDGEDYDLNMSVQKPLRRRKKSKKRQEPNSHSSTENMEEDVVEEVSRLADFEPDKEDTPSAYGTASVKRIVSRRTGKRSGQKPNGTLDDEIVAGPAEGNTQREEQPESSGKDKISPTTPSNHYQPFIVQKQVPEPAEDDITTDASSGDPPRPSVRSQRSRKVKEKSRTRRSVAGLREYKEAPPVRVSRINSNAATTPADRALAKRRTLNHPPEKRKQGKFTEDEDELIRRALSDFQQRKGLDTAELVEIIQKPSREYGEDEHTTQNPQLEADSRELWHEIKDQELLRPEQIVRQHIRAQYNTYRSGGWTEEEDAQLSSLLSLHPHRWTLISQLMGTRSTHDCQNRYRDYLQSDGIRNTSVWTREEEVKLKEAVTTVCQRIEDHRAETGQPPIETYTSNVINWPQVSRELDHSRSRIQCYQKWKKMEGWPFPPQIQVERKPRQEVAAPAGPVKSPKKRKSSSKNKSADTPGSSKQQKRPRTKKGIKDFFKNGGTSPQVEVNGAITESSDSGDMSILDKFYLAFAIVNREVMAEDDIDWHELVVAAKYTWSVRTLQMALKDFLEDHKEHASEEMAFNEVVNVIVGHFIQTEPEALNAYDDPFGSNQRRTSDAGSNAEEEQPVKATAKDRKRRKRSVANPSPATNFKSQEFVESEEDEGEAEL